MSNDEYIHIPRDILKRVLAGDGTTANLGMLKNSDSAGGGWSRGSSCAGGSDGSTTSWLFVTSELEDVQGRDRSSPLSCGKEFSREWWQIFFPNGGGCMHMCILVAFLCLIHPFYIIN